MHALGMKRPPHDDWSSRFRPWSRGRRARCCGATAPRTVQRVDGSTHERFNAAAIALASPAPGIRTHVAPTRSSPAVRTRGRRTPCRSHPARARRARGRARRRRAARGRGRALRTRRSARCGGRAAQRRDRGLDLALVARLHDEDELEAAGELRRELARSVAGEAEPALRDRHRIGELPDERGDPSGLDDRARVPRLQPRAQERLSHGAPADVADADGEYAIEHGRKSRDFERVRCSRPAAGGDDDARAGSRAVLRSAPPPRSSLETGWVILAPVHAQVKSGRLAMPPA
jgi:hypothetical protein